MSKSETSAIMDTRLKNRIESSIDWSRDSNESYSVKFKDLEDTFWFNSWDKLQEFLNNQVSERFYDKELRKGYFDYINKYGETLRYHVESKRGTLTLLNEECIIQA